jgi:hypothetical protein
MMTHKQISFIKSAVRIVGYFLLPILPMLAVIFLVFSEILGIIEEIDE